MKGNNPTSKVFGMKPRSVSNNKASDGTATIREKSSATEPIAKFTSVQDEPVFDLEAVKKSRESIRAADSKQLNLSPLALSLIKLFPESLETSPTVGHQARGEFTGIQYVFDPLRHSKDFREERTRKVPPVSASSAKVDAEMEVIGLLARKTGSEAIVSAGPAADLVVDDPRPQSQDASHITEAEDIYPGAGADYVYEPVAAKRTKVRPSESFDGVNYELEVGPQPIVVAASPAPVSVTHLMRDDDDLIDVGVIEQLEGRTEDGYEFEDDTDFLVASGAKGNHNDGKFKKKFESDLRRVSNIIVKKYK